MKRGGLKPREIEKGHLGLLGQQEAGAEGPEAMGREAGQLQTEIEADV